MCNFIRKKPKSNKYEFGYIDIVTREYVVLGEALSSEEALMKNNMALQGANKIGGVGSWRDVGPSACR